jgi:hypothetical protein
MFEVRVGDDLAESIAATYGPERSARGRPSEWDFWNGPLVAALIAFRDFDSLRVEADPRVRSLHVVDPVFGPVVFIGVLVDAEVVELAAFATDPDYWTVIEDDPDG